MASAQDIFCHVCGTNALEKIEKFSSFFRVTSDTKPWHRGGELAVCRNCGVTQKPITDDWQAETAAIYGDYTLYYQSSGVDQMVFDTSGTARDKNAVIVERLLNTDQKLMPAKGRLLDFGCGRGAFLSAFSVAQPEWELVGYDTNDSVGPDIESIPNARFLLSPMDAWPSKTFNVISLCHVLEHIPAPIQFLRSIAPHLSNDGLVLIQVPDLASNPYDLFVADHCTHFQMDDLVHILEQAGYGIELATTDWINKEISIVARRSESPIPPVEVFSKDNRLQALTDRLERLCQISDEARSLAIRGTVGIFGTAVAGIWLDQQMGQTSSFFADEDPGRISKTFLGRPVIHPHDVPPNVDLLVPFPVPSAHKIVSRIGRSDFRCHILSPN